MSDLVTLGIKLVAVGSPKPRGVAMIGNPKAKGGHKLSSAIGRPGSRAAVANYPMLRGGKVTAETGATFLNFFKNLILKGNFIIIKIFSFF